MPEDAARSGPNGVRSPTASVFSGTAVLRRLLGIGGLFSRSGGVALPSIVVAAFIGASAGSMIRHNRELVLEDHWRSTNSMGIVLVEQTSRYVQVIDMMLREVQNGISNSQVTTPTEFQDRFGGEEFQSSLADRLRAAPQVDAIFLIDSNGIIFNWSHDGPVPRIDSSDRDYYKYFKSEFDT